MQHLSTEFCESQNPQEQLGFFLYLFEVILEHIHKLFDTSFTKCGI